MPSPVLDAHALMVYLEREAGFATVRDLFAQAQAANALLPMTTVNLGEVIYVVLREYGSEKVAEIEGTIDTLPIEIVDVDLELARGAARFKAVKTMSYADCFAAALARKRQAELVTGDPEFREVEDEIEIIWVPQQASATPE